jgi:hypothetical protein
MKKFAKRFMILCVMMVILTFIPTLVHATPPDLGCDPLDPACPIDGGLSLLLAAGVGYGIKKVRDTRKKEIVKHKTKHSAMR